MTQHSRPTPAPVPGTRPHLGENRGFSLVELVVTLAIAAIISSVSVPSFLSWRENYRAKAAARQVVSAMQRARIEAIKLNTDVFVDILSNNNSVQIFDSTGTPVVGANDIVLPSGVSLSSAFGATVTTPPPNLPSGTTISFNSRGLPDRVGNITINGATTKSYSVVLSSAGHVRISVEKASEETSTTTTTEH